MGNIFIHNMTVFDVPEVAEIENLSFSTPWSEEAFKNEVLSNLSAKYVVAKIDGKVVGYGGMWIIVDEGHITNIAVHPEYRGMGVGNKIVDSIIILGRREGASAFTLEVRRTNIIALKLYRKYGFEPVGIRPKYYGDNGEDAIIMWKRDI